MSKPAICAVLFDFDGTLADSFAAIAASTNAVRGHFSLPPLEESFVRRFVGYGLPHLMAELVPGADPADAVRLYREHHASVAVPLTRLMPGVSETLPELIRRGFTLAVCSNKAVHFTRQLVDALGYGSVMREVLGPEDVAGKAKPDPAMLVECLNRLGLAKHEAVYIGDMSIDVKTAKAAGVECWLVPGGAAGQESAEAAGPDRVLGHFTEMLDLLPTRA